MVAASQPPQPKGQTHLGTDHEAPERLASSTAYPPSMAQPAVRRHTPEVGAVCGKAARTDLCGGRSAMGVPTATHRDHAGIAPAIGRTKHPEKSKQAQSVA